MNKLKSSQPHKFGNVRKHKRLIETVIQCKKHEQCQCDHKEKPIENKIII